MNSATIQLKICNISIVYNSSTDNNEAKIVKTIYHLTNEFY